MVDFSSWEFWVGCVIGTGVWHVVAIRIKLHKALERIRNLEARVFENG